VRWERDRQSALPGLTPQRAEAAKEAAVIQLINAELVKALKDPQLQERMLAVGAEAVGSTPTEFTAFLNKNTEQWTRVLKESGARLGQGFQ